MINSAFTSGILQQLLTDEVVQTLIATKFWVLLSRKDAIQENEETVNASSKYTFKVHDKNTNLIN